VSQSPETLGTGAATGQRVFLRTASGLIKSAGTTDVLIFNVGLVSVGIGLGTMLLYGGSVYPGANMVLGILIAAAGMTLVAGGMLTWTITIPRSGGVYPFGSRILPPAVALGLSFTETVAWLFYCAIAAYWIITIGIVPTLTMGSVITGNSGLQSAADTLSKPWAIFLVGSAILLLAGGILASGMRRYFVTQKVVFTIGILGSLLLIGLLLAGSREHFVQNFNQYFGKSVTYQGVIDAARNGGWQTSGFSLSKTLLFSNWAFLPLIGAAFSIAIGGEIKSVSRGQTVGMLGAILINIAVWLAAIPLALRVFGSEFLGAVAYNDLNGLAGTPTTPWITLLAGVLTKSWIWTLLVSIGFIAWIWMWIPGMQAYGERAMIAWAFDRIAPAPLGKVSAKTRTPVVAIGVATAITICFLALFAFTSYFITMIVYIMIAIAAWAVVLAAGIAFPYRRPDLYDRSPLANTKLFGFPIMSVACAAGCAAAIFNFWLLFFDSFAAGHNPVRLAIMFATWVFGFVIFWVMKQVRASQGVDVTLAFKEIPIE
jgi:APA family basic amino acid/polyamine antiporter